MRKFYMVHLVDGPLNSQSIATIGKLNKFKSFSFRNFKNDTYCFYKYHHRIGNVFYLKFTGKIKPNKYWEKGL